MLPFRFLISLCGYLATTRACSLHDIAPVPSSDLTRRSVLPGKKLSTVIKNVRIFDGWRMTDPQDISFHGETISFGSFHPEEPEVTVDGTGKFLIPGLIDSHLHISKVSDLELLVSYGVTTGVHMSCQSYEACHTFRNQTDLTSIIFAGTAFTGAGNSSSNLPQTGVPFPDLDESTIIANVFNNGSDVFKVAINDEGPTQDVLNGLIHEVHKLGRQAMTHATTREAFAWAVAAKTDGLQHMAADGPLSRCIIDQMLKNREFVTPTLNIFKQAFENPLILNFLRPNGAGNITYEAVVSNVRLLHQAGVPLLAGTDAVGVVTPMISVPFGLTLHWELQNLVVAGLSPLESLRAATVLPALHHRLEDRGAIEHGKRADLVLLNSNPLDDIVNTMDFARVWVAGAEFQDIGGKSE
ncbi:unnamed protein product [Clonostachys byssicola]|uniref:Amidohydrolase-related domain-containing protein n=1 Tax=Clonostachys byssicola TaxID=160290 RepID=A0A9N9UC88_9HYPO|nr:unnamed protein product [Clonostachys byssicola]